MGSKNTESLTDTEAKIRAKKYIDKFRKEHAMVSAHEDEPSGLLAGNPDNFELYEQLPEYEDLAPEELNYIEGIIHVNSE